MSAISNANRSAGGLGGGAVVAITNPVALMLKKTTNRGQTRCPRFTINTVYPDFLCVLPHTAGALCIFSLQPVKPPDSVTEQ